MNIHEYQAKSLLKKYGVAVPRGGVAWTPDEAQQVAKELGGPVWVVKSQIHAGGRGAGRFKNDPNGKGGVRVVKSVEDVATSAKAMLGNVLVTKQTGPGGREVRRLYVEEGCDIKRELYLGMLIDRQSGRVMVMASTEGGMDIEEVAEKHPEKIVKLAIDPAVGLQPFQGRKIAFALKLEGKQVQAAITLMTAMYKAFVDLDAAILEINPLVVTGEGRLSLLDCKFTIDENALYRQTDTGGNPDAEKDPSEIEAAKYGLSYIKLDGDIGCMVNGAGLAMATMDIIKLAGGAPANFLDVGGGASADQIKNAFRILLADPNVEGILVNIFGGIMRCDVIAEGVIAAAREVALHVPLVVRLEGTNVDLGKKILSQSGLPIVSADNLADAAEKIVKAVMAEAA
ncbi:MAG: ADP-forming succinate--CoA ligase subunit beta [Pseudomonadota bacterium]|nr:ADP-forming succinate--CoA ligase subunit beta [Pseudomonadota bacterium]